MGVRGAGQSSGHRLFSATTDAKGVPPLTDATRLGRRRSQARLSAEVPRAFAVAVRDPSPPSHLQAKPKRIVVRCDIAPLEGAAAAPRVARGHLRAMGPSFLFRYRAPAKSRWEACTCEKPVGGH